MPIGKNEDQEIWLWKPGLANDIIEPGREAAHTINTKTIKTSWQEAYDNIIKTGRLPYLPGEILDEDGYVKLALEFSAVDLQRTRSTGQIFRSFGTRIGSS